MKKKLLILIGICFSIFLVFPPSSPNYSLTSVFRITDEPVAITRGTSGSALTVNISFGDDEVLQYIKELEKPYPLLLIDMEWANRFPETVRLINKKRIPTGLLGSNSEKYEQDSTLLITQLDQFERLFGIKPLWFRTADEVFPYFVHTLLWEVELNALGSSVTWDGGEIPAVTKGEIISIPHHRENRISLTDLKKLNDSRKFQSIEDVIFGTTVKMKKIPK